MDYSSYYPAIIELYLWHCCGLIVIPSLLIWMGVHLAKYINAKSTISLIIVPILLILWVGFSIPLYTKYIKDIPNIINENYIVTTGTATSWNTTGPENTSRSFEFTTDDGEVIKLSVQSTKPVYQGDRYEVIYLPHTKCGAIVRKIE